MTSNETPAQGTCYKFTVASAEQAAALIRERLGPGARVLSVRTIEASGLSRLWSSPRLEVIARVEQNAPETGPEPAAESPVGDTVTAFPRQQRAAAPTLNALLRMSGVSEVALSRIQGHPGWPALQEKPLHRALVEAGILLKAQFGARRGLRPLRRAAFIGPSGSGRTTALCKWLGIEVFRHGRSGRVVAAEFDRPNPVGALPTFCEAMGVPFGRFAGVPEGEPKVDFAYFDTPSISLRDPAENTALAAFLDSEKIVERVLVLNVAYDPSVLRSAYAAGRALRATHVVFTHFDEVQLCGRVWEYLCDGTLEPLFLGTGPALTGDCEENVWDTVVRRTLACADTGIGDPDDAEPAGNEPRSGTRRANA